MRDTLLVDREIQEGVEEMSLGMRNRTVSTKLKCEECGNTQTIQRRVSRQKAKNHLKHMYCPSTCLEVTGHLEIKGDADLPQWIIDRDAKEHEEWLREREARG